MSSAKVDSSISGGGGLAPSSGPQTPTVTTNNKNASKNKSANSSNFDISRQARSEHSTPLHSKKKEFNNKDLAPFVIGDRKPLKSLKLLVLIVVAILAIYFAIVLHFMNSTYMQSFVVYMHLVDLPFENLDNLFNYGLSNARNVNITTSDNVRLRAWHLLPAGDVSMRSLDYRIGGESDKENEYYDNQLANAKRIFVYCHGNSASRGFPYRVNFIKQLSSHLDAHVVAFDYRGFADSEGLPSEEGTLLDTEAVISWIHNITLKYNTKGPIGFITDTHMNGETTLSSRSSSSSSSSNSISRTATAGNGDNSCASRGSAEAYRQPHLYFYGHSLGTGITTAQAIKLDENAGPSNPSPSRLSGIILDCPFTDLPEAALSHPAAAAFRIFTFIKNMIRDKLMFRYATIDRIGNITIPILLVHGEQDNKLPPSHSHRLKAAADKNFEIFKTDKKIDNIATPQGFRFITHADIPHADHGNVFHSPLWLKHMNEFVKVSEEWTEKKLGPLFCNGDAIRSEKDVLANK